MLLHSFTAAAVAGSNICRGYHLEHNVQQTILLELWLLAQLRPAHDPALNFLDLDPDPKTCTAGGQPVPQRMPHQHHQQLRSLPEGPSTSQDPEQAHSQAQPEAQQRRDDSRGNFGCTCMHVQAPVLHERTPAILCVQ